ncbi:MAG: hypothetical protein PHV68_07380 [Candidatus Gastranaerophilales bacterium]|nr:hypothetical protein [Candidatus Gastranaerophilales bacterium]
MKREIKKLNELGHLDSFMQVNYLRGFKFIDNAGEIVNKFYLSDEEPFYKMTQRELIIKEKISDLKEYKITVNNLWYHDAEPQNLGNLIDQFLLKSDDVLKILNIDEIIRVGWRNYFVYEIKDVNEKNRIFSNLSQLKDCELLNVSFKKNIKDFTCFFNVKSAEKQNENKKLAIIIDVDCFQKYENKNFIGCNEIGNKFKNIKEIIYSDIFLDIVNQILGLNMNNESK